MADDASAACTLVFGHGRNMSVEAPQANALWNELNRAFNQAVAGEVGATGRRTLTLVLPVEARDLRANAERLLALAATEGCDRVVETTVFGDAATELLVVRLRVHAILRAAGSPRIEAGLGISPPSATVQRELPLTSRSLARLSGGELVRQLTAEALGRSSP